VFSAAAGSVDATRAYLESLLYELLERAAQSAAPPGGILERTEDRFRERLRSATTIFDLPEAFEEAALRLREAYADPGRANRSDRLELARRIVEQRFAEPLRLSDVARKTGFSRSQFASLFKRHTGTSFGALLHRVRLEQAKRLLLATSLPVSRVAAQAGYQSHRYFCAAFRRQIGMTPAAFRRAHG
jgi:AraC-like DNA-binding protein